MNSEHYQILVTRLTEEMNRHAYGFEVDKQFYKDAKEKMLSSIQLSFTLNQMKV